MICTILFRICTFLGICRLPDSKEMLPTEFDLNSFSSKTAYRNSKLSESEEGVKDMTSCKLIHTNMLLRHGTRFPSAKDMEKVSLLHKKIIRSHARMILPKSFLEWKMPFSKKKEKILASVGYEEMLMLGRRMRSKFSQMNGLKNLIKHVKVFSSSLSRAKISAVTFLKSFFENEYSEKEITKIVTENDDHVRFYNNCPYYTKTVLKGKSSKLEYNRFMNGPEMKRVIKEIQMKWKLTDIDLSGDDVRILYRMCALEIATNLSNNMKPLECPMSPAGDGLVVCQRPHRFVAVETSPLCSLLESEHLLVLEYLLDLEHYWTKSYGQEINWMQSCELLSPMLQQIMAAARGHRAVRMAAEASKKSPKPRLDRHAYIRAAFWFGHAETLLPLAALLGLFNQSFPMSASDLKLHLSAIKDPQKRFSTFRVSNIAPFSGNILLELHHCPKFATGNSGYRIQVKVNEKRVMWPLSESRESHTSLEAFLRHVNLCLPEKYDHSAVCVRGLSLSQLREINKRGDEL